MLLKVLWLVDSLRLYIYIMYELNMTTMLFFFVCQYFVYHIPNGCHNEETREHPMHRIAQFLIVLFHILRFKPNTMKHWYTC